MFKRDMMGEVSWKSGEGTFIGLIKLLRIGPGEAAYRKDFGSQAPPQEA